MGDRDTKATFEYNAAAGSSTNGSSAHRAHIIELMVAMNGAQAHDVMAVSLRQPCAFGGGGDTCAEHHPGAYSADTQHASTSRPWPVFYGF